MTTLNDKRSVVVANHEKRQVVVGLFGLVPMVEIREVKRGGVRSAVQCVTLAEGEILGVASTLVEYAAGGAGMEHGDLVGFDRGIGRRAALVLAAEALGAAGAIGGDDGARLRLAVEMARRMLGRVERCLEKMEAARAAVDAGVDVAGSDEEPLGVGC